MKPMTLEEIRSFAERKSGLERKCLELQQRIAGRSTNLLSLLRTKTGRYSDRQTRGLAVQLAALAPEELEGQPLVPRQVLEDFIYCALRFVERSPGLYDLRCVEDYDYEDDLACEEDLKAGIGAENCVTMPLMGGEWDFTGSFENLLRVARETCCFVYSKKEVNYRSDEVARTIGLPETDISDGDTPLEKWRSDFCRPWTLVGTCFVPANSPVIFQLMDEMYHRFCGHSIREDLAVQLPGLSGSPTGPDGMKAETAAAPAWEDRYAEALKEEGFTPADRQTRQAFFGEGPRGHYAALWFSFTKPRNLEERYACHDPNLTTVFPNKEAFCQSYLRLRRACFEGWMIPQYLWHAVEIAVDTYLCRTGRSCCMNDDDFFTVYGYLEQAVRRSRGGR